MTRDFDVAVVGAGPAGSTAARAAAERGLAVLLIDKAVFPRRKPCAGGVTAKALRELGFSLPEHVVECEIHGVKLVRPNGRSIVGTDPRLLGVTVRREAFDALLAAKAVEAGARFIDGTRLLGLEPRDPWLRGRYVLATDRGEFAARAVIGADGVTGPTARLAGIRAGWRKWELGLSLSAEIEFPRGFEPIRETDLIELHLVPPLRCAFGWAFHRRGGLQIGVAATALDARGLEAAYAAHAARVLRGMGLDLPSPKPEAHALPMGGCPRPIGRDAVLLAGDAAGFVDPFSGEGIYYAIRSGKTAAEVLAESMEGDCLENAAAEHSRRCLREFAAEFRLSALLALALGRKDGLALAVLEANPGLVFPLVDLLHAPGAYRRLLRWCALRGPLLATRTVMAGLGLLRADARLSR